MGISQDNLIDSALSFLKENTQVLSNQTKQSPKAAVDLLLKLIVKAHCKHLWRSWKYAPDLLGLKQIHSLLLSSQCTIHLPACNVQSIGQRSPEMLPTYSCSIPSYQ